MLQVWTTPSCRPLGACETTLALLAAATAASPQQPCAMPFASPAPTTRFAATPGRSPPLSSFRGATPLASCSPSAPTPATTRRAAPTPRRGSPADGTPGPSPSPRGWAIGWAPASARRSRSPAEAVPFPSPARLMAALGGSPAAALWGRALTRAAAADAARAAEEARVAEAAAAAAAERDAVAVAAMPAPVAAPVAMPVVEQPSSGGKRRSPRSEARIVAVSSGTGACRPRCAQLRPKQALTHAPLSDKTSRRLRAASRMMIAPPREAKLSPASAAAARLATRARALGLRLLTSAPAVTPPSRRRVAPRPAPAWPPGGAPPPPPEYASPPVQPAAEAPLPQRSPALFCAAPVEPVAQAPAAPSVFTFSAGTKAMSGRPARQRSFGADVTNAAQLAAASPTLLMR